MNATDTLGQTSFLERRANAWTIYNSSFHMSDGEACRVLGKKLYQEIMHEQIQAAFARGDRQNVLLDRLLGEAGSGADVRQNRHAPSADHPVSKTSGEKMLLS